jgi:hypothetical protein
VAPEIRYAKSGDVHIAYQVFGHGADSLIIIPGFSHTSSTPGIHRTRPAG